MKNNSFDSTSFFEQLGIYDSFNVLLSGAVFVWGLCIINRDFSDYIWKKLSFQKWVGIILFVYILGMILQEISSRVDRKIFNIYTGMSRSILKGELDNEYKKETSNEIIKNPIVLQQYRKSADKLLKEFISDKDAQRFENEYVNGFIFSICQYYVAICGKDKKVEKLRALSGMSKILMICFWLLSGFALFSVFTDSKVSIPMHDVIGFSIPGCETCANKVALVIVFGTIGIVFYFRAKQTMKRFLLILLGTYNALISSAEEENSEAECKIKTVKVGGNQD